MDAKSITSLITLQPKLLYLHNTHTIMTEVHFKCVACSCSDMLIKECLFFSFPRKLSPAKHEGLNSCLIGVDLNYIIENTIKR